MLHFETVDEPTLALLEEIQGLKVFSNFRLVGGTALALQLGHRKSIDLDFLLNQFNLNEILSFYIRKFNDASPFLVLKSLTYFADSDSKGSPVYNNDAYDDKWQK